MTTYRSFASALARRFRNWLKTRAAPRVDSLRLLDARGLADIGVDASEIQSIEAEWHGISPLTRTRIMRWERA